MPNLFQSLIITKYKPNIKTQGYDHCEWLSKVLIIFGGFVCLFYILVGLEIVPKVLNILNNYANTKFPPRLSCVNLL